MFFFSLSDLAVGQCISVVLSLAGSLLTVLAFVMRRIEMLKLHPDSKKNDDESFDPDVYDWPVELDSKAYC